MESKPNRIEIFHQTEDGEITESDIRNFDTPEAAQKEHDRMYEEDSAQELGVSGETDYVWTYLYVDGKNVDRSFYEWI
jgi:hypothetical protein